MLPCIQITNLGNDASSKWTVWFFHIIVKSEESKSTHGELETSGELGLRKWGKMQSKDRGPVLAEKISTKEHSTAVSGLVML